MKKILGLDLGTNSIGWALIEQDLENKAGQIIDLGSRIIPMSQDILGKFDSGVSISQTAERTGFRGVRRLRERHLLRRERLHRILNILGFLPGHYANQIDFEKYFGQFVPETEPKLVYNADNHFIFKKSFEEMVAEFKTSNPALFYVKTNGKETKIPYDWTIYYLRKKALTHKIEKEELAWLLLNFNQKRGYYQREDDEDSQKDKSIEIVSLKVIEVEKGEKDKRYNKYWYKVKLENGWSYNPSSYSSLSDWVGNTKEFIVVTELNTDGSIKLDSEGKEKRRLSILPSFEEIDLMTEKDKHRIYAKIKLKTEQTIDKSGKTVGQYIYDTLLQNPSQKINGKLVRVIERKFYKDELKQILETQQKFHTELQDKKLYEACLTELYENNEAHRGSIAQKDVVHLFLNDIIFYQRPLKSKTSLISDCRYETRKYKNEEDIWQVAPVKCIAKSHPLFQEFRLWQWMKNLAIFDRGNDEQPITTEFLQTEDDYVKLFDLLNSRKEITQDAVLKFLLESKGLKGKALTNEVAKYRWNFIDDKEKKYPCNETRSQIVSRLEKCESVPADFLTTEKEEALWHILYSVNDKKELETALKTFAGKNHLGDDFVVQFKKFPPYKNEYGSYSAKAIKKLLPLMRMGKHWNENAIHPETKERIDKIITGEYDEKIQNRVREKAIHLSDINNFKGLPLWLTCYVVYNRHSEEGDLQKWKTPVDLDKFLKEFKQHSLRNPIVEQVITETLRVVNDIWKTYGEGKEDFFNEIHIELGREMKNPADKRKSITEKNNENENTNLRIKALLAELLNDKDVENVRPYSPMQQEILKIYEDGILNSSIEIPDDILKISKAAQPTKNELLRYKLWLEQKYRSPYTGAAIPLNRLFTPDYEIEHIIPQSRYFDDSFSNKVICESEVNKLKDKMLALEFIQNHGSEKVTLNFGKTVEIFSEEAYKNFIKEHYAKNFGKRKKLELTDIPEKMIERQMNDTRYISKEVKNLLSKIVRQEKGDDGTTSNNVLSSNGQITTILKQDWGLNDIWNDVIEDRFKRLNEMTGNDGKFGAINPNTNKFLPTVPIEFSKGFSKKRIDHRHHAMDALVIACASRSHINFLNNQNALEKGKTKEQKQESREDLRRVLCDKKYNEGSSENYRWVFKKPWNTFTQDSRENLFTTIVSFKQNLRVINKTVNKYQCFENGKKIIKTQEKGDSWAIRKPMHAPMPYGKKVYNFDILKIAKNIGKRDCIIDNEIRNAVISIFDEQNKKIGDAQKYLKENPIKDKNGNSILVTAFKLGTEKFRKRQPISKLSNRGLGGIKTTEDAIKFINKVADLGIRNDLLNHLKENENDIDKAFNPDGIERFNAKRKISVYKLPIAESGDKRFSLGNSIGARHKYMEAAEGTNLFFAIYLDKDGKRTYQTVPFNVVVENQKQGLSSVPNKYIDEKTEKEFTLLFHLSPNDLVYVPIEEERENPHVVDFGNLNKEQVKRIYKFVDSSDATANFIPANVASLIFNLNKTEQQKRNLSFNIQNEFGLGSPQSKNQNSTDGIQIKSVCWKLQIDRLGKINSLKK